MPGGLQVTVSQAAFEALTEPRRQTVRKVDRRRDDRDRAGWLYAGQNLEQVVLGN